MPIYTCDVLWSCLSLYSTLTDAQPDNDYALCAVISSIAIIDGIADVKAISGILYLRLSVSTCQYLHSMALIPPMAIPATVIKQVLLVSLALYRSHCSLTDNDLSC